jgi:two-component system, OmpR family, response regulator
MAKQRILIVEDVVQFRILIQASLGSEFEFVTAETKKEALERINQQFDLVLLDVGLPDGDGYDICLKLRQSPLNAQVPIVFLTAREERDALVTAYRLGADDFITKPFDPHVLRACAVSKLRRFGRAPEEMHYLNLVVQNKAHRVFIDQSNEPSTKDLVEVKLTKTEFSLLSLFVNNIETVFTREEILEKIWGAEKNVSDRTIDVHVTNLRKKVPILDRNLESVHGRGYRLRSPQPKRHSA